jgi:hypothetical protein
MSPGLGEGGGGGGDGGGEVTLKLIADGKGNCILIKLEVVHVRAFK